MATFFFLQLALGLLIFLMPVPLPTTGKGFGKLIGIVSLGALLVAALLRGVEDARQGAVSAALATAVAALIAAIAYVGVLSLRDRRKHGVALWIATLAALVALVAAIAPLPDFWRTLGNALLSALLLGAITDAMVLGHWYIVLPKMTLVPLRRLTIALMALLPLRALFIALCGEPAWPIGLQAHPELLWPALLTVQRLVVGIAVPFVFAIMIWKTARIRSTQSATGILYVTNVFVFVGELISTHMTYGLGRIC